MPFRFNPITGQLDIVGNGGSSSPVDFDDILTHEYNSAGSLLRTYDPVSNTHILAGPTIVIDNSGKVVGS